MNCQSFTHDTRPATYLLRSPATSIFPATLPTQPAGNFHQAGVCEECLLAVKANLAADLMGYDVFVTDTDPDSSLPIFDVRRSLGSVRSKSVLNWTVIWERVHRETAAVVGFKMEATADDKRAILERIVDAELERVINGYQGRL
jgi:hypothetical protein